MDQICKISKLFVIRSKRAQKILIKKYRRMKKNPKLFPTFRTFSNQLRVCYKN